MEHDRTRLMMAVFYGLACIVAFMAVSTINRDADERAMKICQIEHSFDVCFKAMNP